MGSKTVEKAQWDSDIYSADLHWGGIKSVIHVAHLV